MKLQATPTGSLNAFTGYGDGYVIVNHRRYQRSVVVLPERVLDDWPPQAYESLLAEHCETLAQLDCEVVLIGTGSRLRFPAPEVMRPLIDRRIGFEVMDVRAACRTYNILLADGRKVAAALLLG